MDKVVSILNTDKPIIISKTIDSTNVNSNNYNEKKAVYNRKTITYINWNNNHKQMTYIYIERQISVTASMECKHTCHILQFNEQTHKSNRNIQYKN